MSLTGQQYHQLTKALLSAFPTHNKLRQLVRFRLDQNLDELALGDSLTDIAFKLIEEAEAGGWTPRLVEAARASRPENPAIVEFVSSYTVAPYAASRTELQSILNQGNSFLDPDKWLAALGRLQGQVCRVTAGSKTGTGFLVGPSAVLTNYHVVEDIITGKVNPADVTLLFDYKLLASGSQLNPGTPFRLSKSWLLDKSPPSKVDYLADPKPSLPDPEELDYALLSVDGEPGASPIGQKPDPEAPPRGFVPLPAPPAPGSAGPSFKPGAPLQILQHPSGRPLKLAIDTSAVVGTNDNGTRVRYRTNTEPGSSGSPCFDQDWNLVALHHAGDPSWSGKGNEGIPITAIAALLSKRGLRGVLGDDT
jgi:hypothetical protein